MKIYLAGPDVFRRDAREWAAETKALCRRHGFEALTPLDHDEREASRIFAANLALIEQSTVVIANLNPFRGCEPDSGTCFEIGYAHAHGKKVCAYLDRKETLRERVNRYEKAGSARTVDDRGMAIEDFGLPVNLMLALPMHFVGDDLEACLKQLHSEMQDAGIPDIGTAMSPHPKAKKTIDDAIRYLHWAEAGRINDPDALATIARHYKVNAETVRAWLLDSPPIATASGVEYLPEDVIRHMKISGRQYRSIR